MNDLVDMGAWSLWAQSDAVGRAAAVLLLAMSVATWYLILAKGWQAWRVQRVSARLQGDFWAAPTLDDAVARVGRTVAAGPYACVAEAARLYVAQRAGPARGAIADCVAAEDRAARVLRAGLRRAKRPLESGLGLLASIGATAPFIGLFGTVWGIYHALVGIGISGQASIDKVAGPVGEALIMTALGIAVAVPAVLAYNFLLRANRTIFAELDGFAHDMGALLLAEGTARSASPVPPGALIVAISFGPEDEDQPMAEVNTTPLVDVMLVLLIIFMVTAPLFTHAVKVELPRASSDPNVEEPGTVALSIDATGTLYWNGESVTPEALQARLAAAAAADPQPGLQLRADRDARYGPIAEVLSAIRTAGLTRVGFVTDPSARDAADRPSPAPPGAGVAGPGAEAAPVGR